MAHNYPKHVEKRNKRTKKLCTKFALFTRFNKENLTKENVSNKIILVTDYTAKTAWHMALDKGNSAILYKIYDRAIKRI
jgi:hypothetical protein